MQPRTVNITQSQIEAITVRQAILEDLEQMTQWTLELHQHEDDGDLKMRPDFGSNLNKWLSQELTNANSLFLIAQSKGTPVGFIFANSVINDNGFLLDPLKGIVHLLWVVKDYRKQHVAAKLLDETEKCFSTININYVECNYTANNQLARKFWDKKGYIQRSITARKALTRN